MQAFVGASERVALKIVHGVSGTLDAFEIGNPKTPNKVPVHTNFEPGKANLTNEELEEFFLDGLAVEGAGTKIADVEGFVGRDWRWPGIE